MMGEQLRRERARLDMTQDEMAAAIGASRRTVQRWERGEQPIPLNQQARIAAVLAQRDANPLDAYPSVELLAEVIRRLNPAVAAREIELLASVIRSLAVQSDG